MRLEVVRASMDDFFPGVFVIGVGTKLRPPQGESGLLDWRLGGALSTMVRKRLFEGNEGEKMLYWNRRRRSKIYFFGTGAASRPAGNTVASCAENMVKVLLNAGECEVVLLPQHLLGSEEDVERAVAFLSGLLGAGKGKPDLFDEFRLFIAGDTGAQSHYEALRKAMLRKGKNAEPVELVYSEGAQALQPSRFVVNH